MATKLRHSTFCKRARGREARSRLNAKASLPISSGDDLGFPTRYSSGAVLLLAASVYFIIDACAFVQLPLTPRLRMCQGPECGRLGAVCVLEMVVDSIHRSLQCAGYRHQGGESRGRCCCCCCCCCFSPFFPPETARPPRRSRLETNAAVWLSLSLSLSFPVAKVLSSSIKSIDR